MRAQSETERRVLAMIEPEAEAVGLEIVRVSLTGGRDPVLQVMAERPDGTMDVEDCARLSRRVSPLLDSEDPVAGRYTLEVSSPGIDRPLTRPGDFAKWVGHEVRVEIGVPVDGRRRFHGHIAGESDGVAVLDLKDGARAEIPLADMVKARLVLTDALIDVAQARGQIPATDDEERFDEIVDELNDELSAEAVDADADDDKD